MDEIARLIARPCMIDYDPKKEEALTVEELTDVLLDAA